MGKVLIVGSNAARLALRGGEVRTGNYLNETVVPAMALVAAGHEVVLATPSGAKPPLDARSDVAAHFADAAAHRQAQAFWAEHPSMNVVQSLSEVIARGLGGFDAIFVPGGHAPIMDLMQDRNLGTILHHFHAAAKPTALLCHGPVAILAALPDPAAYRDALVAGDAVRAAALARDWPYAGYRMTVYSDSEEAYVEDEIFHARLLFGMEDALGTAGGQVVVSARGEPHVIEDRELITGQNPRSDRRLAETLLRAVARMPARSTAGAA